MRITNIEIERYGTINKSSLNASDLTVLIGKNGSGKSFILEALSRLFTEFNYVGGGLPGGTSDYLWFDRDRSQPIKIRVSLELAEEEAKAIVPLTEPFVKDIMKSEGKFQVHIARSIDITTGWHTQSLRFGAVQFVEDDRPVSAEDLSKHLMPNLPKERFVYHLFTAGASQGNLTGEKLLVDLKNKLAYHGSPQVEALVVKGVIPINTSTIGKNIRQWVEESEVTLLARPPKPTEVPELQLFAPEFVQNFLTNLTNAIRNKFRLIPAVRDVKGNLRQSFLEPNVVQTLTSLANSTIRPDELRWEDFRNRVETFLNKKLEPNPGQVLMRDADLRLPTANIGGGEQSILGLMYALTEKNVIFGIEEPESHLHADLVRKFSTFMKELSKESQIFLVTHSPLLVDRSNIGNNWLVSRNGKESTIKRLEKKEDFALVLHELGVFPSDIYLSNGVIFVEGGTEKEAVFPILAEKLGLPLDEKLSVISLGGAGKLRDNLRIWLNIVNNAPIEYYVLLDKDAEGVAFASMKEMGIPKDRFYVLQKGSIEDYYPDPLVVEAMNEVFGVSITQDQLNQKKPKDKIIESILQKEKKLIRSWKILLGETVASRMNVDQVPEEIKSMVSVLRPLAS